MPILARLDFLNREPIVVIDPDQRRLDFVSIDGSETLEWCGAAHVLKSGITGLRVPPRRIVTAAYPGMDGERITGVSTGPREVVLPIFMQAPDRQVASHLGQLDEVRRFADYREVDPVANDGTFDLVATGQDGQQRSLRCLYVDGMEGSEGRDAGGGSYWSIFDVKLLAVAPYWMGVEWTTPSVGLPAPRPFLSSNPANAWPRQLSASIAIGADMPLSIPGDVPSSANVELIGPSTTTHVVAPGGLDVTIGPIAAGDVFTLETGRRKRALLNGVSAWEKVGTSPKWRPLRPGATTISVEMSGATAGSRARVYGRAMWETAW